MAHPIRVMLVDDHRSMLWGLGRLLENEAPRMQLVHAASTRAEALAGMRAHTPDVVLLDLDLGADSGVDLMLELSALGDARFVVLTGAREATAREQAIRAGARGLVLKTEPAEAILSAIIAVHAGDLWFDRAVLSRLHTAYCDRTAATGAQGPGELTLAERRIVAAVMQYKGAPNKVIAGALCISTHTLRNHLASIYDKLRLHRRVELVLYALEHAADLAPAAARRKRA